MLSYLRLQKLVTCFSLKKEIFNSTNSRSSYPKTCKSLFLNWFKTSKQSLKGVMQKFEKNLQKETPSVVQFCNN